MSTFIATIKKIQTVDTLNLVTFDFHGAELMMMSLGLHQNIQVGKKVSLVIKSTAIALAKEFSGELSYANKIHASIVSVDNGELLSSVKLQANGNSFECLITKESSVKMNLQAGDIVLALLKASELSIAEVLE